jgi:hypothetical protein
MRPEFLGPGEAEGFRSAATYRRESAAGVLFLEIRKT